MRKREPKDKLWVVYNHLPGGHIVAQNFEENVLTKRLGDQTEEVIIAAQDQARAFEKSDFVALNLKGTVTKNKVLVYEGPMDKRDPRAADRVIEWAKQKGVQTIKTESEQKEEAKQKRLESLELEIAELKGAIGALIKTLAK